MTTVNIPQRLKKIIERQVLLDYDKVYDDAHDSIRNDNNLHNPRPHMSQYSYNDNFSTVLCASIIAHDEDCDDYPYGWLSDDCECNHRDLVNNITLTLRIKYNDSVIHTQSFDVTKIGEITEIEKSVEPEYFALRFFNTIPDSVILCVCGERADDKAKDKCRRCYLDSYTRTEEEGGRCSICFENEGVWFKTHCNHFFHQHCLLRALKAKRECPLCRTSIPNCIHAGGELNPYNV
jgi:hypothetical protein